MHDTPMSDAVSATNFTSLWESAQARDPNRFSALVGIASGVGTPLYLVHWGSGNISFVREFADEFRLGHPVYGLQAVGLHGRERPYLSVPDMAEHYLREIRAVQPSGPYMLGGLCGGGQIAYEMACQLSESDAQVGPLLLINAARGELENHPKLGLDDLYELRLAELRREFAANLDSDIERVTAGLRDRRWIHECADEKDFFWHQLLYATDCYAYLRCRLRRYDGPVHVMVSARHAANPAVRWRDIAPNSVVTSLDACTSPTVMQTTEFASLVENCFRRVSVLPH